MSKPVITGVVRASYANVFEARAIEEGQTPKYSISLIIPKSDKKTLVAIEDAIEEAKQNGKVKFGGRIPAKLKLPLRDGDDERPDDPAYKNSFFVNANATLKPQVVDRDLNPIMDREDFYSGCYCRASITFYAFNTSGNKGIACGLNNVMFWKHGEKLGGGTTAAEDFGDMEFDDDDMM